MVGVVRHHDHAHARLRERLHAREHELLVAEVEACGRLVHDEQIGLLREGARNQHELLLAARKRGVGAIRQMLD